MDFNSLSFTTLEVYPMLLRNPEIWKRVNARALLLSSNQCWLCKYVNKEVNPGFNNVQCEWLIVTQSKLRAEWNIKQDNQGFSSP